MGGDNQFQYAPNPVTWIDPFGLVNLPVPEITSVKIDGEDFSYKSNPKHTLGGEGNRKNAGLEPCNSLELFQQSKKLDDHKNQNSNKRYAIDSDGHVHQFTYEGSGSNTYHWAGSSGDSRAPMKPVGKVRSALIKIFQLNPKTKLW